MTSSPIGATEPTKPPENLPAGGNRPSGTACSTARPRSEEIGRRLAARTPDEAEISLVSLVRSHGVGWRVEREITFERTGPKGERMPARPPRILGVQIYGDVPQELRDRAQAFLAPAPRDLIEEWLAELSVLVVPRRDDPLVADLTVRAYAQRLGDFPADLVRHALLERRWKFWPTWAELEELLEEAVAERRAVIEALTHPSAPPASLGAALGGPRGELTDAERNRRSAVIGDVLKQMRRQLEASGEHR